MSQNAPVPGESPDRPKTCDASGMAMIHRVYRAGFGEAPGLVSGVRDGDLRHAAAVAQQLDLLSVSLHAHHEGEDERLWPALSQRAPGCALHVERMKAQHARMLVALEKLDAALPRWRASGVTADADPVLAAVEEINDALAEHLPDEEQTIVPVMETVITQPEVEWFSEHGRRATPKGQTWNTLGMMLAAQPDGGEALLRKELPPPVRWLWKWIGKRRYARTRAALQGWS
ncbi:MAG: hemerythrin domain-containing protein [Propionicimonas sp.]